jgi:hypothetical protein
MTTPHHCKPAGGIAAVGPRHRGMLLMRRLATSGTTFALVGGAVLSTQTGAARQHNVPEQPSLVLVSSTKQASAADPDSLEPPPAEETDEQTRKEIRKARDKAAAEGVPLKRPLAGSTATAGAVNERSTMIGSTSVRVMTARMDLTGQPPLNLVAGRGEGVGSGVTCTNRIRFSLDEPAVERPTLLLCWRTAMNRSVVTMAVTPKGQAPTAAIVDLMNREWAAPA